MSDHKLQRDFRRERGLYNVGESAAYLKIGQRALQKLAKRFPPSVTVGKRACFTADDLEQIKKYIETSPSPSTVRRDAIERGGYLSIKGAARATGVPCITWRVAVETGRVPRPTHPVGFHHYYTLQEAEVLAQQFGLSKRPEGMYDAREVAEQFGVCTETIYVHARKHGIGESPSTRRRWFTEQDVDALRKLMNPVQTKLVDGLDLYLRSVQDDYGKQVLAYIASKFEVLQAKLEGRLEELVKQKKK